MSRPGRYQKYFKKLTTINEEAKHIIEIFKHENIKPINLQFVEEISKLTKPKILHIATHSFFSVLNSIKSAKKHLTHSISSFGYSIKEKLIGHFDKILTSFRQLVTILHITQFGIRPTSGKILNMLKKLRRKSKFFKELITMLGSLTGIFGFLLALIMYLETHLKRKIIQTSHASVVA